MRFWLSFWTRVDRWAEALAPPSTPQAPRRHERGTLLVRISVLALLTALFILPLIAIGHRDIRLAAFHSVAVACMLLAPYIMKRTQTVAPAAWWILATGWILLSVECISLGGAASPAFIWLALLPIGAMLVSGGTGAVIWGAIAMATVFGIAAAEAFGMLPGSGLDLAWIVNRVAAVFILAFAMTGCAWIYERELDRRMSRLDRERRAFQIAASSDPLTRLPNRTLLADRIEQVQARARRHRSLAALLYADLDDFKQVNDEFGHDAGDQVLLQAAERMRRNVRGCDTVIRLGGDEFILLVEGLASTQDAAHTAEALAQLLEEPYLLDGTPVVVGVSIGIALIAGEARDDDDSTPDTLLKRADQAMYDAKRARLRHAFASDDDDD